MEDYEMEAHLNQIFSRIMSIKRKTMNEVNDILTSQGLKEYQDYMWSLQGPTLIYIGETNPFQSLGDEVLGQIRDLGVLFLVDPSQQEA